MSDRHTHEDDLNGAGPMIDEEVLSNTPKREETEPFGSASLPQSAPQSNKVEAIVHTFCMLCACVSLSRPSMSILLWADDVYLSSRSPKLKVLQANRATSYLCEAIFEAEDKHMIPALRSLSDKDNVL